ncbi:MAG: UDP-2,3-diacylglucosamine diphosphatase [Coxiellaceae bacterium]|jgi:UDP-2,3-diacylglucosamine hydrolase|nr:UDP-2,3-diacylglucosamine diphosphatase [Coxiellaceae bacterium]
MYRYTIFISDLHLSSNKPDIAKLFCKFLEEIESTTDAIYILGDLFQLWIGDDDHSIFNEQIKNSLRLASSKTLIYLMPGNRDFLLGSAFARESGCILIPDPYEFNLYGKRILLTHGDLLCSKDSKYHIFRKIIRIHWGIKIFLRLPLKIRSWFAINTQKISTKIKAGKNHQVLVAQLEEVSKNLLCKYNSDQLIHGHVHVAETGEFEIGTKQVHRFSLGGWDTQGSILLYYSNNNFAFKILTTANLEK